jgi:hypothetical protein
LPTSPASESAERHLSLGFNGWFHEPGSLVVVAGALEIETKNDPRLSDLKMGEVRAFISKHALETSVVRGDILAVFPP